MEEKLTTTKSEEKEYWVVEAMYLNLPFSRKCHELRLTTVKAERKPRFAHLTRAGLQVYREGFTRKSRAMKRVNHIYARNPHLDD
jgi:hypothetical protein